MILKNSNNLCILFVAGYTSLFVVWVKAKWSTNASQSSFFNRSTKFAIFIAKAHNSYSAIDPFYAASGICLLAYPNNFGLDKEQFL